MALRTMVTVASAFLAAALMATTANRLRADPAGSGQPPTIITQAAEPAGADDPPEDESPEARMRRRFPQKIRVGDLIGLPVLDDNDVTLGHIQQMVRNPQGKIKLIVSYSRWFGWNGRLVAVPIEAVAILGRQLASLDMQPQDYAAAPTWSGGDDRVIPNDEIIHVAIARR